MINRLPFDAWLAISSYLPVLSIVNLSYCCKHLYDTMDERSVWILALGDILDVIQSATTLHSMESMSSSQLRKKALRMAAVDSIFDSNDSDFIEPTKVQTYTLAHSMMKVAVASGGEWIMIVHEGDMMHLHRMEGADQRPLVTVKPSGDSPHRTGMLGYASLSLSSSGRQNLALVSNTYFNTTGMNSLSCTEFRVYSVDLLHPSVRLLTEFVRPQAPCYYDIADGLLATGWVIGNKYFLGVRKVPVSANDVVEEVIMDLGSNLDFTHITILCPHLILVSAPSCIHLYYIPELSAMPENSVPNIVPAIPLAKYVEWIDDFHFIWNTLCKHHSGRMSPQFFSDTGPCFLVVFPSMGQSHSDTVTHLAGTHAAFGPTRVVWLKETFQPVGRIKLESCVHFTKLDTHPGYMRLGRTKAPDPSRICHIAIYGQFGPVQNISWDEESGKICIVCLPLPGEENINGHKVLLLVDLV